VAEELGSNQESQWKAALMHVKWEVTRMDLKSCKRWKRRSREQGGAKRENKHQNGEIESQRDLKE
jgi:TPR repeat protein